MMGQNAGRCHCSRSENLFRTIVNPWLIKETPYGRLLQRIMDFKLQIYKAKSDTPEGSLHVECLHLRMQPGSVQRRKRTRLSATGRANSIRKPCSTYITHEEPPYRLDRHTGAQQAEGHRFTA